MDALSSIIQTLVLFSFAARFALARSKLKKWRHMQDYQVASIIDAESLDDEISHDVDSIIVFVLLPVDRY